MCTGHYLLRSRQRSSPVGYSMEGCLGPYTSMMSTSALDAILTIEPQVSQAARILYCVDLFLIKLAILLQLLRIFVPAHSRNVLFWTCHALIWLNFIYYAVYIFLAIFLCKPVKLAWISHIDESTTGTCLDLRAAYITGSVINTVSDISIVVLPQPWIWDLQLSLNKKKGLGAIFFIGIT